jgi:hypothetical protein
MTLYDGRIRPKTHYISLRYKLRRYRVISEATNMIALHRLWHIAISAVHFFVTLVYYLFNKVLLFNKVVNSIENTLWILMSDHEFIESALRILHFNWTMFFMFLLQYRLYICCATIQSVDSPIWTQNYEPTF